MAARPQTTSVPTITAFGPIRLAATPPGTWVMTYPQKNADSSTPVTVADSPRARIIAGAATLMFERSANATM